MRPRLWLHQNNRFAFHALQSVACPRWIVRLYIVVPIIFNVEVPANR
jgi:hypothetical protein